MPVFGDARSSFKLDHKLNSQELIRAIRFFIAAEYEAIQMYMQVAEVAEDDLSKKVLKSISEEELVHAGEFLALLKKLSPEENSFYEKGEVEVNGESVGNSSKDGKDTLDEHNPEESRKKKLKELFGDQK